jgi:hypothetical protein
MAGDSDWVQDVRRWYFGGNPPSGFSGASNGNSDADSAADNSVGYEAAHPSLQKSWPEAGSEISAR